MDENMKVVNENLICAIGPFEKKKVASNARPVMP